eukprot:3692275-Pyramimonas_sp.AAC.1
MPFLVVVSSSFSFSSSSSSSSADVSGCANRPGPRPIPAPRSGAHRLHAPLARSAWGASAAPAWARGVGLARPSAVDSWAPPE